MDRDINAGDKRFVVVVDTNLFIAGRWNPGSSSNKILDAVIDGRVEAVYTAEIKDENLYILQKVRPPKDYLDKILRFYQASRKVYPKERITVCPDKSDNRFLEAAVEGKADYVVSSDHHLLDIREYRGVKTVKPSAFMKILGESGDKG